MATSTQPTQSLPQNGRAFVKAVLSGDTVILRGKPVNGPPPEKTFSLAGISAPRLGTAREPEKEEVGCNCIYDAAVFGDGGIENVPLLFQADCLLK